MEEVPLKRVGRYDLLEVIGRGGAAVVYLARQTDLQRHVALKELAPFHAADETFAERFVVESRLAGAMNHANIVTVHEFFETEAVPYIAMEYLAHGSLRQYVDKLSLAQIAGVLEGVLAGLSYGESMRVVHRDLKPENLLVSGDGRVKIADFGVARAIDQAATRNIVTVTGTTIGTPAYMAPEQALGTSLTAACDLYSLGIVAWELLAGRTPFAPTDTPVAILYRQVHEEIAPVSSLAPDVDPRIDAWVSKLLAKEAVDRPASADEAWWALEDIVLDLLGPRWRRDARIAVIAEEDEDEDIRERAGAPLTPAPFTEAAPAITPDTREPAGEPARKPAREPAGEPTPEADPPRRRATDSDSERTAGPGPGPDPDPGPDSDSDEADRGREVEEPALATIAPSTVPPPSNETIIRPARRHRDQGPGTGQPQRSPWRRRAAIIAATAATAGAAVAGVLVAGGGSSHPSGPSPAQLAQASDTAVAARVHKQIAAAQAKATTADHQLEKIVSKLAPRYQRANTRLLNATTPTTQRKDADAVRADYSGAATQARKLASKTVLADTLTGALDDTAKAYGKLASAVHTQNASAYASARRQITSEQKLLERVVKQL